VTSAGGGQRRGGRSGVRQNEHKTGITRPLGANRMAGQGSMGAGKGAGGMGPSKLSRNIGKIKGGYHGG
jgi:hypothetical protein